MWNIHEKNLRFNLLNWEYDDWKSFDTLPIPFGGPSLNFIDDKHGWIAGGNQILDSAGWQSWTQVIYNTSDGGYTWEKQRDTLFVGVPDPIIDIKFHDENFGIASSYAGFVLVTTDGGKKWKDGFVQDSIPDYLFWRIESIQVPTSTTAFVIGNWDYIYKYTLEPTDVKEDPFKNSEISIYPNPAMDIIHITGNINNEPIRIYSLEGIKLIDCQSADKIDISSLVPGIYIVKVGSNVLKLIKI